MFTYHAPSELQMILRQLAAQLKLLASLAGQMVITQLTKSYSILDNLTQSRQTWQLIEGAYNASPSLCPCVRSGTLSKQRDPRTNIHSQLVTTLII